LVLKLIYNEFYSILINGIVVDGWTLNLENLHLTSVMVASHCEFELLTVIVHAQKKSTNLKNRKYNVTWKIALQISDKLFRMKLQF